jgi:hypothetical protein
MNELVKQVRSSMKGKLPAGSFLRETDPLGFTTHGVAAGFALYSNAVPCASITLCKTYMKTAYMKIDTLKFDDEEKQCRVSGSDIIKWAKSLHPAVLSKIDLEDASQIILSGIDLDLTFFRKLTLGKGWYEHSGFYAKDPIEHYAHQDSFHRLRASSIDHLVLFMWGYIAAFLHDVKIFAKIRFRKLVSQGAAEDVKKFLPRLIWPFCSSDIVLTTINYDKLKTNELMLRGLVNLLEYFGLPPNHEQYVPTNIQREKFLKQHEIFVRDPVKTSVGRIFYRLANRPLIKKIMSYESANIEQDEVRGFLWSTNQLLATMHALQLIHKPYDLEFPSRLATPVQVVDAHAKK